MRFALVIVLVLGVFASGCRGRHGPPPGRRLDTRHHRHVVREGETAWGIARTYGVSVKDLLAINGLGPDALIHPGETLVIPGEAVEAARRAPPPPPPPKPPVATAVTPDDRPKARRCADVKTWLAPPDEVGKQGFSWPVDGVVIMKYGKKDGLPYEGIAIAAPVGTEVRAAADGKVTFAGAQGGFGNLVVLQHAKGRASVYAHQHVNCVEAGQKVSRGELVGLVGQTGGTQSPYLYFEVRDGKATVNPRVVLP